MSQRPKKPTKETLQEKNLLEDNSPKIPFDNYKDYGILRFVQNGNIVRITHKRDRYVAIMNSIPKYIVENRPKVNPEDIGQQKWARHVKRGKGEKDVISVSTMFSNHLSSVLQRKHLKEVELNVNEVRVGFVTLDEYAEIEEYIFKPNISSDVRGYAMAQKESNKKLIKRVLRGKCPIVGSMGNRPSDTVFDPKVLTVEYETSLQKREAQNKLRRHQILKKAKEHPKDPIEQYKLKQRMEKLKMQRNATRAQRRIDKLSTDQRTGEPIEPIAPIKPIVEKIEPIEPVIKPVTEPIKSSGSFKPKPIETNKNVDDK